MAIASVAALLTPLALLACPVGMGAMMWMMMRGNKSHNGSSAHGDQTPPGGAAAQLPSLEVLREEQRRLSDEIERLEAHGGSVRPVDGRPA